MKLTKQSRIILNTLATYGRSLIALLLGVFSSRWLLQGLGAQDLGLQGVVGSLVSVIIIFETVMQVAVARFYSYAIGQTQTMGGEDELCRWFNVVFLIYVVMPVLVTVIGYQVGIYAIKHWLEIPGERMSACLYVFRCSILASFISVVSVPYIAMYQAHQEIVELSMFGLLRSIMNFLLAFSLIYVTCDRLKYAATFGAVLTFGILGTQMLRARMHVPERRVKVEYLFDWNRICRIFKYFLFESFSCTGDMVKGQGSAILINKCFGPEMNASWTIANNLSFQATSLSNALISAILPAVTAEEGAGERNKMIRLSFRTCKFGCALILVFSIPLVAEMDEVLHVWLINPPPYTAWFCICILLAYCIDKLALGHHVAISAKGKIGLYHSVVGTTFFLSIPIAIGLVCAGFGPLSIGMMYVIVYSLISIERIILAHYLVEMSVRYYILRIILPISIFACVSYSCAHIVTLLFPPSFLRIVATAFVAFLVMCIGFWFIILDDDERLYIRAAIKRAKVRFRTKTKDYV